MSSQEDKLINLAIHESSDPEMLRRDAESKTGTAPNEESFDPEMLKRNTNPETTANPSGGDEPQVLKLDSDAGITREREDFSHEYEEERENTPRADNQLSRDTELAMDQNTIANLHAGWVPHLFAIQTLNRKKFPLIGRDESTPLLPAIEEISSFQPMKLG